MINVENISKSFGATKVLNSISFQVGPGQIVGFLGENGAGKTTTLDLVTGCIGPDAGKIEICGIDLEKNPVEAKSKLGYLPDEPPTFDDMDVYEYLEFCASIRGLPKAQTQESISRISKFLELESVLNKKIETLSKGYKQRVGLAQAMIHDPQVLILDEPTEGLDPSQIASMRRLLIELKGEKTILISSHILSELEKICDDVIVISNGELLSGSRLDFKSLELTYKSKLNQSVSNEVFEKIVSEIEKGFVVESSDFSTKEITFVVKNGEGDLLAIHRLAMDNQSYFTSLINQTNNYESLYFKVRSSNTNAQESL